MPAPVLQFKRGAFTNLPGLRAGEPGFTTDKYDFYVGLTSSTGTNKFFGSARYWSRENGSSAAVLNLVDKDGSNSINLKAADTLAGIVTFTLPSADGTANQAIVTDGVGGLSFATVTTSAATLTGAGAGVTTFLVTPSSANLAAAVTDETGSGSLVFANSPTLVSPNIGDATATNLNVSGITTLAGNVFLGDNTSDDITVGGEFVSSLNPSTTNSYDLGTSTQRWRDLFLAGNLNVAGVITATQFNDLLISNKDIVTAYVDGLTETDTTANHGGIAVASTEGYPLVNFPVSGINTLPVTYKQIMWVKGGTYGVGTTDAWLFNYAVGVGSTQVPDGVRLAAGGMQVTDTTVSSPQLSISGIATIGTGVGVTQFSGSVSTGTSTSSVPTSSAVIDYVGSQIGNVDLTLGIDADTGGPSTVNTSQTLTIAGTANEIETSVAAQTITVGLPNDVVVGTSLSASTIKTATLQASDGTTGLTIANSTGALVASNNLTVAGDLYVNGTTTQINTTELTVYDRTVTLGIQTNVTPTTTTWDLGVMMNYGDAGVAKTAGVIWQYSNERFIFSANSDNPVSGNDTSTPVITVATYAPIEVGALWVNDCAGQSQVISCTGTERFLENITVDAGTF